MPPSPNVAHIPVIRQKMGEMGRDKALTDSGSPEDWKARIPLNERLMYIQLKLSKPVVTFQLRLSMQQLAVPVFSLTPKLG